MLPSVPALVVIAAQIIVTIAFYAAVRWTGEIRAIAFGLAFAVVILAPLAIAPERREVRLGIALVAAWMSSKLYDLFFGVTPNERPGFGGYVVYVFNPFWMVHRLVRPNTQRLEDLQRLSLRIMLGLGAFAACFAVFHVHWSVGPFALEHAAKVFTIMPLVIFTTNALAAAWRVAGGRGLDAMGRFPLLAATPGEFWRRWNQPAQQFFLTYGAAPLGGMRRPIRATLATFAISAAGHEYIFSVAAGHLQGYQTAFFLLHGLAVVATLRLRPTGWRRIPCILATLAFVVATTLLFGLSLNEIVPIYDAR